MKKVILLLIIILCATYNILAQGKKEGFNVNIHIKNMPDCDVLVAEKVPNTERWFVDTLQFKKGHAVYQGRVAYPRLTAFVFNDSKKEFLGTFSMFIDNSPRISVTGSSLKDIQITGSPANDEYQKIEKGLNPLFKQFNQLRNLQSKAYKDNNQALKDSTNKELDNNEMQILDFLMKQPQYSTSKVIPYYIEDRFKSNIQLCEKALSKISPALNDNGYVKSCREELNRQKRTSIGQSAFNFNLQDIAGKTYRLSDFSGKYVLIEFSASWCGWCKKEIPFLKKLYEANKDNPHFAMLTINLDDKRKNWEEDVKEYNLPWPVISDLKAFKSDVATQYNVHGIPMIYLIGPDGKIAEKGLRGENMIRTVKKHLDEINTFAFTLKGRAEGLSEGYAFLYLDPSAQTAVDSCKIKEGNYTLNGRLEKAKQTLVMLQDSRHMFAGMFYVYAQPGMLNVTSYPKDFQRSPIFANAPIQTEVDSLHAMLKRSPYYKEYNKQSIRIQEEYKKNSSAPQELKEKQNQAVYQALQCLFPTDKETESEALAFIVNEYQGLLTLKQLETLYQRFSPGIRSTFYANAIRTYLDKENKLKNGQQAPDFQAEDLSGKSYTLQSFKGKYVFLEFSASWCGWCKKEVPYIRKAYETLKGNNIVFVTLMMDSKKKLWEDEVRKLNIPWLTLSDLKGIRDSKIAHDYNVTGIPASFVIDPNGRIINRDLRGDNVLKVLKELK